MRVLFTWHAAVLAGNQVYIEKLSSYNGMEVFLLIPPAWDEATSMVYAEKVVGAKYETIVEKVRNPFKGLKFYYQKTAKILREVNPDVIFIYEEPYSFAAFNILYCKQKVVPRAKTLFYTWQNLLCRYPFVHRVVEKYVFSHVDMAIAGSEDVLRVLQKKGFRRPIRIVPLALSPELFPEYDAASLRQELGLREFTIGYVGRITKEKGIQELFEAVAPIKSSCQILVIGSGQDEEYFRQYAESVGLKDRIIWLTSQHNSQMYKYYRAMDALILPSRTTAHWKEQFGRTLIEAMVCKIPVIGSSSGEIPNVIADAGLIFEEGNICDLREKIMSLQKSQDKSNILKGKGYARVMSRFTWGKVAEDTRIILNELVQEDK